VIGRTSHESGAALRAHLLDTAERLIGERPVGELTAREIARAADVSTGVLYNYFADKNELVVAALSRRLGVLIDAFAAGLPEPGTGTVAENLVSYVEGVRSAVDEGFGIAAGVLGQPDLMHRLFEETHADAQPAARMMALMTGYLGQEQRLGRLRPDAEVPAMAALVVGACVTMTLSQRLHPQPPATVEEEVRHVVDLLLAGIGPGS
jgi:AcrR family transcriptional regulator